jgi:hypothetical protein
MTEKVKTYLQAFFLAGDENKTERMSANEMVEELKELAKEGEIQTDDIPQVKTVENWISRTSAALRKQAAAEWRLAAEYNNENSQIGACSSGVNTNAKEILKKTSVKNNNYSNKIKK